MYQDTAPVDADDEVVVKVAEPADVPVAAAVLEEAIAWAGARGYETWRAGSFVASGGSGRALLRQAQAAGALYLGWSDGIAIATFTLLDDDPMYWPHYPPDALYLHRLAVRRSRTGIGRHIVEWVAAETRRRGRSFVRLDCLAGDPRIREYYERAGFLWRREVHVNGRHLCLYERPL